MTVDGKWAKTGIHKPCGADYERVNDQSMFASAVACEMHWHRYTCFTILRIPRGIASRQPEGFNEFDGLMRKLVNVPKAELDKQLTDRKKKLKKK